MPTIDLYGREIRQNRARLTVILISRSDEDLDTNTRTAIFPKFHLFS